MVRCDTSNEKDYDSGFRAERKRGRAGVSNKNSLNPQMADPKAVTHSMRP